MPPKPISVDGVTKQAVPAPPHSTLLNEEIKREQQGQAQATTKAGKNQVRTSRSDHGTTIVILLTLVFMVLLIGLAYFAYTKSK